MLASSSFRAALHLTLFVLALALSACSDGPNTQYLPIGQRCGSDEDCGTSPFACQTNHPGGYCYKNCSTDGDCPLDSVCASGRCRRKCTSPNECRTLEGYTCLPTGATSPYCDVSSP
jgi:hypothetical protein